MMGREMALGLSDFAFFLPPPDRPSRSAKRTDGAGIGRLLRTIRNEIALAAREPAASLMPRIRNYPY